jgi:hypothetical protein
MTRTSLCRNIAVSLGITFHLLDHSNSRPLPLLHRDQIVELQRACCHGRKKALPAVRKAPGRSGLAVFDQAIEERAAFLKFADGDELIGFVSLIDASGPDHYGGNSGGRE